MPDWRIYRHSGRHVSLAQSIAVFFWLYATDVNLRASAFIFPSQRIDRTDLNVEYFNEILENLPTILYYCNNSYINNYD